MIYREVSAKEMAEHRRWMSLALEEARLAALRGEVPVGAVIVRGGEVLARGGNTREGTGLVLGHAELSAIDGACRVLGDWRLTGCTLYVTLEPCCMCAGACLNARLERVVFGAADEVAGCLGSRMDLFAMDLAGEKAPKVLGGILEEESQKLLQTFFAALRPQADPPRRSAAG